jgi:hypothetical protein
MDKTLKNTKLWADTLYKAKLLAAMQGTTMVDIIHQLITKELENKESGKDSNKSR